MSDPKKLRGGYVETYVDASGKKHLKARIMLADGTRDRLPIPEKKCFPPERAKDWAAFAQQEEDRTGVLLAAKRKKLGLVAVPGEPASVAAETCDKWFARYFAFRRSLKQTSVRDDEYRYNVWIKPKIGHKAMVAISSDDIEDVRDALDLASRAWLKEGRGRGRISGKTAKNVWNVLKAGFSEATSSKQRDLRVLPKGHGNPCTGVQAPDGGATRRKPYIYPSEFLALAACEAVPLEWREVHAIAVFTYLRPGELRVLRWTDVDLEHGTINVSKAWDYAGKEVKAPKTLTGVRQVPIEPALLPLLERMHKSAHPEALVVPVVSTVNEDLLATMTRAHLLTAKVTRAALHENTTTAMPAVFRSWRDTGITWLAISGVDLSKIKGRAGHEDIATSDNYVKAAENLSAGFGEVFPALPTELVQPKTRPKKSANFRLPEADQLLVLCEGRDLNPYRSYPART